MAKNSIFEKIMRSINGEEVFFTPTEEIRRERMMHILELKMKNLWLTDFRLYKLVQAKYPNTTFPQVSADVTLVERMIATDKDPTGDPQKVWIRYFLTQVSMDAIRIARAKNDAYTMTVAAGVIGKHWKTDKDDVIIPPYDQIIPFKPILTYNPEILGFKRTGNIDELREKLKVKYDLLSNQFMKSISIPDVEVIEKTDEEDDN